MKKIALFFLGMSFLAPSYGQDTITESSSSYFFWPHFNPLCLEDTAKHEFENINRKHFRWYKFPPGTIIYGVSIRGDLPLDSSINISLAFRDEGNSAYTFHDTAYLDSSVVYRYFSFSARLGIPPTSGEFSFGEKCNEIYFHHPWAVPDTACLVIRFFQNMPLYMPSHEVVKRLRLGTYNDPIYPSQQVATLGDEILETPVLFDTIVGGYSGWYEWGGEFPILEPNRIRCRKPTGARLLERGDGWVTVGWSGAGDSFRVTVEGPYDTAVYETADTLIRLNNLVPDTNYWVEVQSLCRYQYRDYDETFLNPGSSRLGFRTFSVGVDGAEAAPQVAVYPNPASDRLVLEAEGDLPVQATLMDLGGREILSSSFLHTATLDVSRLSPGQYLLRLTTPSATTVRKLLLR